MLAIPSSDVRQKSGLLSPCQSLHGKQKMLGARPLLDSLCACEEHVSLRCHGAFGRLQSIRLLTGRGRKTSIRCSALQVVTEGTEGTEGTKDGRRRLRGDHLGTRSEAETGQGGKRLVTRHPLKPIRATSTTISMSSIDVYRVAREGAPSARIAPSSRSRGQLTRTVIQGSRISSPKPCKTTLP